MDLYKFRNVNTNNLTALANRQLWFSNQSDFNDPFEGAHIRNNKISQKLSESFMSKSKEEIGENKFVEMLSNMGLKEGDFTKEQLFQRIAEHDIQALINIVHNSRIVSLSLYDPKNNPLNNNLMWSHYADGLRGFCLVFDGDSLQKDIYSSSDKFMKPIKIQYKSTPNTLHLSDFINSEIILGNNKNIDFIQNVTETIATKSNEWSYENEFRIVVLDNSNFHSYSAKSLKEIVIGEKMPSPQRKLLLDTVKANHPEIITKEARLKPDSYSLEIVPL